MTKFSRNIFVLLTLSLIVTSCTKKEKGSENSKPSEEGRGRSGRGSKGPSAVRVFAVVPKVIPRKLEIEASLNGRNQVDVYSKVVGRITSIGPTEGTRVNSGTVLFKVDRSDAGESFLSVPVASPISGWIGSWNVTLGTQVTVQDSVVTVVDDQYLRATIPLPVADWAKVTPNTRVLFKLDKTEKEAKIVSISRAADTASGRGTFIAEIPNPDRILRAGTLVKVQVEIDPKDRLIIPVSALSITEQGAFVFVVENEKAKRMGVKYKLLTNDDAEVLSGLASGASVIIEGRNNVTDGSAVKVIEGEGKKE